MMREKILFYTRARDIILPQQSNQFFEEEEEEDKEEMIWFWGVFYVVRLYVRPPLLFAPLCTTRVRKDSSSFTYAHNTTNGTLLFSSPSSPSSSSLWYIKMNTQHDDKQL
jgi:hypothetical protein